MLTFLIAPLLLLPQDADRLIRDLADDDVVVRDAAQVELVKMGKQKAEPVLTRAAAHKDPEVRARAGAIRRIFDPPPPTLQAASAVWILDDLGGEGALVDVSDFVTIDISISLVPSASPPTGPAPKAEDVRLWIGDLAADALKAREAASAKLRAAGKHVEKELKEAAASRDREVAFRARSLLSAMQPRTVASTDWEIYPHLDDMFGPTGR